MTSEHVRIRIVREVPVDGEGHALQCGSELQVPGSTAAALVLSGAAIELRLD